MKDLSLSDTLRYLFPGMVLCICLYFEDKCFTISLFKNLGVLGVIAFVFSGSIMYLVYRAIIFNYIIMPVQDCCRKKSGKNNHRTFLKDKYDKIKSSLDAQLLWIQIKHDFLEDKYSQTMTESASGVHLLYMAGIIAFGFFIANAVTRDCIQFWVFLGIALIVLSAACLFNKTYEEIEYRFLCSLCDAKQWELDQYIKRTLTDIT